MSEAGSSLHNDTEIGWDRIDKVKFHVLGAGLFTVVSASLHPLSVVKTRVQVASGQAAYSNGWSVFRSIIKSDGIRGLYRGFGTSAAGSIPGRSLFLATLEMSKESIYKLTLGLNLPEATRTAIANSTAGLVSSLISELYYVPLDVVTQRLMVQGLPGVVSYRGGIDGFQKIFHTSGLRGLYRGFGMSVMTYCPSTAVWWGAYGTSQHLIWRSLGYGNLDSLQSSPSQNLLVSVQAVGGVLAGAASSVITTPLDTIKTRLQVMENTDSQKPTIRGTVKHLVSEDGWKGFYRGLGPRFVNMSLWGTSMIVTYEFLKRLSLKQRQQL